MNTYPSFCHLDISDLRYLVRLGVSAAEQTESQLISVTIHLRFTEAPRATQTDQLMDTFCYFALSEKLQAFITQHEPFHLVEYLGGGVYACVYEALLQQGYTDVQCEVAVKKVTPPVPGLHGGVTFCYSGLVKQGTPDDLHQYWF